MVLTCGQARAGKYFGGFTATSSDSEVSCNPAWLDTQLLGQRYSPDSTDSESDQQVGDMAVDRQERRIQLLESAVMAMTEKFDELLSAVNPMLTSRGPTAVPAGSPHHEDAGARHAGRHCDEAPPAALNHRAPGCADFVSQRLRREEFAVPRLDEGKNMAQDPFI